MGFFYFIYIFSNFTPQDCHRTGISVLAYDPDNSWWDGGDSDGGECDDSDGGECDDSDHDGGRASLRFKKTEFLDKSSKTIDILLKGPSWW